MGGGGGRMMRANAGRVTWAERGERAELCGVGEEALKHLLNCEGSWYGGLFFNFQNKDKSMFRYCLEFRSSEFPSQGLGLFPKNSTETTIVLILLKN